MRNAKTSLLFPIALVFYEIATYLSNDMYLPSLPTLAEDFHSDENIAQHTLLAWFLGSASMQLFMGPLSDRFGRKVVLISGGVFFIFSSLVCATTHDMWVMMLARFIQGSTVCSVVVAGYSAIHEYYPTKMAIKIIAIMGSVTILAPAIGPLIGALIIEVSHWRYIFYLLAFWAIVGLSLLTSIMPETNPHKVPLNIKEILIDYLAISQSKTFLSYMLPFCLLFMAIICWVVESPFIIIKTYKMSVLEFGYIQAFVFGGFIAGAQATQTLVNKFEPLKIIHYGLLISVVSALLFMLSCCFTTNLYWIVTLMMMICFGSSMAFSPLNRGAIESCNEPMGRRMAIFTSYMSFFGVIATALSTWFENDNVNHLSMLIGSSVILAFVVFHIAKIRGSLSKYT